MNRLLVIEDEAVIRKAITRLLERHNYEVVALPTVEDALELNLSSFDLVIADLRLPGAEGTDIIAKAAPVPAIIMTSHASVRSAVESMKLGAIDYISKPFDHDEMMLVIERSLRNNQLQAQYRAMQHDLHRLFPFDEVITQSPELSTLIESLSSPTGNQPHIFLSGERGTGKELLARLAHHASDRSDGPLVFADLPLFDPDRLEATLLGGEWSPGAPSDTPRMGLLQSAHRGTLLLRNVELLSHETQKRLVNLLKFSAGPSTIGDTSDNKPLRRNAVNVRLIAISLLTPGQAREQNIILDEFAELFEQNCFVVPPLRERRDDLAQMSQHYLNIYVRRYRKRRIRLSTPALNAIQAYDWPGNVNELKSTLERGALLCDADEINPSHLGLDIQAGSAGQVTDDTATEAANDTTLNQHGLSLDGYFRYYVLQHQHALSETELANRLGISRKSLWERRQKMNLPRPEAGSKSH